MLMPGRSLSTEDYRFGFNGQEKDDEIKGSGNSIDFGDRLYDSRLGRWLSTDLLSKIYTSSSNYGYAGNSPILFIDIDGNFKIRVTEEAKKKYGLSAEKVVRMEEVLSKVQTYLQANPDVLKSISTSTGMPENEILADADNNNGPTIVLAFDARSQSNGANANRDDYKNNEIHFDGSIIKNFEDMEFKDEDEKAVYYLALTGLILHEYTHLGDRYCNWGDITGQKVNDILNSTTPQNGVQNKKSKDGHRGNDTENVMYKFIIGIFQATDPAGDKNWSLDKPSVERVQNDMKKWGLFNKVIDFFKKKTK